MKIVTVVGARPQFIKAATVSRVLKSMENISEFILHTGQHYDENMSEIFFRELEIPNPYLNLNIGSGHHGSQTGRMLEEIENCLLDLKPDFVIVYGDTNSTLAGALASAKLNIPIAHVEAGLRSFNREMPEELNRIVTDHLANLCFAPTPKAMLNLKKEGIKQNRAFLVGDVMLDAALFFKNKAINQSKILDCLKITAKRYILATLHRAQNTDDPIRLNEIVSGLLRISKDFQIILALHPRTKKALTEIGRYAELINSSILIIDPVGYVDMVMLELGAIVVITDSGGVQKEAYFFGVPCITLRAETEWIELVESGWNKLVSELSCDKIYAAVQDSLNNFPHLAADNNIHGFYGDGGAAKKIVDKIEEHKQ